MRINELTGFVNFVIEKSHLFTQKLTEEEISYLFELYKKGEG